MQTLAGTKMFFYELCSFNNYLTASVDELRIKLQPSSHSTLLSRSLSPEQDNCFCWYHQTFKDRARRCTTSCSYNLLSVSIAACKPLGLTLDSVRVDKGSLYFVIANVQHKPITSADLLENVGVFIDINPFGLRNVAQSFQDYADSLLRGLEFL